MPLYINPNSPLPNFRVDLKLYKGPADSDGSPTYNLFDPVNSHYYKINWAQSLILKNLRHGMSLNDLQKELNSQTTSKVTRDDIKFFYEDALRFGLLVIQKNSSQLLAESQKSSIGFIQKLFYRYLYFRIPILKPDKFLKSTLPYVEPLASKFAFFIYFLLAIAGLTLLINRYQEYIYTFTYFFNVHGLLIYILGVVFFKIIHEFSHAYTAAHYNVHIPSMGVAFILFIPVLYTDTTDGWKLSKRNERIAISAAGLISEIILAGICTLGWALSSPGPLQSVFFVISSVLWFSSVLINMNPAMRYDGYYLLSDWLQIDNLQSRAFTLTRWWIRRLFFGINIPYPEEDLSKKMTVVLIAYTLFTWTYRLIFYLGLAVLMYLFNPYTKLIGVALFCFTIMTLIVLPVFAEITEIIKLQKKAISKIYSIVTVSAIGVFLLLFIIPLPHKLNLTSVAIPLKEQNIYVPVDAKVKEIHVARGDKIVAGQLLVELSSQTLNAEIVQLELNEKILEREVIQYSTKENLLPLVKEKTRELESIRDQLSRLKYLRNSLNVYAEMSGDLMNFDVTLKPGQYVPKGKHIGTIITPNSKIIAFVPENSLAEIYKDQPVEFFSNKTLNSYPGKVEKVSPVRTEYLQYPGLASLYKGELHVIIDQTKSANNLKLTESFYNVEISLDDPKSLYFGESGTLSISSDHSFFNSSKKYLSRFLWRESGI